jgi:hypothetical protein
VLALFQDRIILQLAAKVGELLPAEKGGRGKKTRLSDRQVFNKNTMARYRKFADYQAKGKIDAYWAAVTAADHETEMSGAGALGGKGEQALPIVTHVSRS